jgi:phosphate transport system substrate-binding protein
MKTSARKKSSRTHRSLCSATLGSILLAGALAGCSPAKTEKVVILGSNTVGEELAPKLVAEYKKAHPEVAFETEFKGTTYGLGALIVGRCDIAAASRDASTNEISMAHDRGVEFKDDLIGSYAVAVVVNPNNTLTSLTRDQVRDLFTGVIQNWKEIGGPDAPVRLCIRNPISGTYLGFRELAMDNKAYGLAVQTFTNYDDIVQAVGKDAGAVGYTSLQTDNKGVKAVGIGDVAPSMEAVRQGKYPFCRALHLYTSKVNATPAAQSFVAFVTSPEGQKIVDQDGFITIK